MKKWIPVSPLGRRLILSLMLIGLIVSSLSSAIIIWANYQDGLKDYEKVLQQISQSYQESLANSLWTYDFQQLKALAQGILNFPGITFVQIDNDQEIFIQHGDMYQPADKKISIPLFYSNTGETLTIGQLRVNQSYQALNRNILNRAIDIIISQLILAVSVALIVLYVIHKLVTRRLLTMANWANNFNLDRLDKELLINSWHSEDELTQVASAINQMRLTLKEDLRLREQEHEIHTRLQNQLALAVDNAELGFCRYHVVHDSFEANYHFSKQIGLTEAEIDNLSRPMNYFLKHIFGEQADQQTEQLKQLLKGQKSYLHDRYILNSPKHFSVLDINFQAISYVDNQPEQILICSTDRTNEFNLQARLNSLDHDYQHQVAETEARFLRRIQRLQEEKNTLKRESRRLRIGQQPKHIQMLTHLMAQEISKCQEVLSPESFYLWNRLLSLDFYQKLSPLDLSNTFSGKTKKLIEKCNQQPNYDEDLPLSLIVEENPQVFDFLIELIMFPCAFSSLEEVFLYIRLIHNDIHASWTFTGTFDITVEQQLAFQMASLIVQMRYNGKFEYKKSDDQLILSITAPFRT